MNCPECDGIAKFSSISIKDRKTHRRYDCTDCKSHFSTVEVPIEDWQRLKQIVAEWQERYRQLRKTVDRPNARWRK